MLVLLALAVMFVLLNFPLFSRIMITTTRMVIIISRDTTIIGAAILGSIGPVTTDGRSMIIIN